MIFLTAGVFADAATLADATTLADAEALFTVRDAVVDFFADEDLSASTLTFAEAIVFESSFFAAPRLNT